MAYKFYSPKKNNIDKETAYILYMMLGSYFKKTLCLTQRMEDKLFLYYQEMPEKKQFELEDKILKFLDKELEQENEELACLLCQVRITQSGDSYFLTFRTGFKDFTAEVNAAGGIHLSAFRFNRLDQIESAV